MCITRHVYYNVVGELQSGLVAFSVTCMPISVYYLNRSLTQAFSRPSGCCSNPKPEHINDLLLSNSNSDVAKSLDARQNGML